MKETWHGLLPRERMTFTYQICRDDLLSYFRHFYHTSPQGRRLRMRYVGSWTGLYIGVAILISLYFQTWLVAGVAYGAALILRFLTVARFDMQLEKTLRKLVDDPQLLATLGDRTLLVGDDGLREITAAGELLSPWSTVGNVVVEPERIFIRTGGAATIVSRTAFAGPIPFDELPAKVEALRDEHAAA